MKNEKNKFNSNEHPEEKENRGRKEEIRRKWERGLKVRKEQREGGRQAFSRGLETAAGKSQLALIH